MPSIATLHCCSIAVLVLGHVAETVFKEWVVVVRHVAEAELQNNKVPQIIPPLSPKKESASEELKAKTNQSALRVPRVRISGLIKVQGPAPKQPWPSFLGFRV